MKMPDFWLIPFTCESKWVLFLLIILYVDYQTTAAFHRMEIQDFKQIWFSVHVQRYLHTHIIFNMTRRPFQVKTITVTLSAILSNVLITANSD